MRRLPVPPLAQTTERFLRTCEPLLTEPQSIHTRRAVDEFLTGVGPACQAEVERFAREQDGVGQNWMSADWLAGYLDTPGPVTLSTNFGAQLAWPRRPDRLAQAADLITRVTSVHLAHLRAEIETQVSPRGDELDMQQWRYLTGGIRHPGPDGSELREGSPLPAARQVVVLHRNNAFAVTVSDDDGHPLPAAAVARALRAVVEVVDQDGQFCDPAYLAAADASSILQELLTDGSNREIYRILTDALFVVNLCAVGGDDAEQVRRTAFAPGQAWPLKSTSYQVSLADGWTGVQIEHSVPDGGTVDAVVQRALAAPEVTGDGATPVPVPLRWAMTEATQRRTAALIAQYAREAQTYLVDIVSAPFRLPAGFRLSLDGAMQWVMLYAQLAAYGTVRSTYESVSMTEYLAGRTECLRPVTSDAVTLVESLIADRAGPQELEVARRAHSAAVVECKTGQGIDRHLLGLRLAARRLDLPEPPLFSSDGYRLLTTDFLSTTSLGGQSGIVRFAFAPTSDGGIGVNYTPVRDAAGDLRFEFCVSHRQDVTGFLQALVEGAGRLDALVQRAAAAPQE